jgi:alpha-mannosidase
LVSDHKYGYAVEGNVMRYVLPRPVVDVAYPHLFANATSLRLSLLRSSKAPDPEQDMGMHDFSFAIMPHVGRLVESAVPKDALRFTNPIRSK